MREDASGETPDAARGTRALPKIETPGTREVWQVLSQLYVKEQTSEHVGSPWEDFSRGEKKSLVRHYPYFYPVTRGQFTMYATELFLL
jgi:hypothetical protein